MSNKTTIKYIANIRIPTEKAHGFQITRMCEKFAQTGADVELIVPTRKNQIGDKDPFDYYHLDKNFKITKIQTFDPVFLFKAPAGIFIKIQSLLFMSSLFWKLLFQKNKEEDIFYTRDEMLLPLFLFFSKNVVWEAHSLPRRKKSFATYFKKAKALIVLTEKIKKDLMDMGVDGKKIFISPDAVDLKIFDIEISKDQARQEINLPQDKTILGYTGTFKTKSMDKGIGDILKAMKDLGKDIIFVAVGGNQKDIKEYRKAAEKLGVSERVLLFEKVPQSELSVWQKAFDMLLMPFPKTEHYAYYMSPLKMFEYMAAKRPIIASDLPSIKEVLSEKNAIICQPDNPKDLAEKIKSILQDKDKIDKISMQAYQDAQKYTWEKRAKNILNNL